MIKKATYFITMSTLATLSFSVNTNRNMLPKGHFITSISEEIDKDGNNRKLIDNDSRKETIINPTAKFIEVVNAPTLTIISKETYEDQYKNEVPFKHIVRLKSLNPDVSFRSIPETKERLSIISFPSRPVIQAYRLYSGSFLIVEISEK